MTPLTATPSGYGPAQLQSAYQLTSAASTNGTGQIVAIVDAFDDPTAETDLAVYRSTFALPPCTTANRCFLKVNQSGMTAPLPGTDSSAKWEEEESLDLDMVSAICPNCRILLVEADTSGLGNLFTSEDAAANCGATEISNSWGGAEAPFESMEEPYFNHPGIVITAASGDGGYNDPSSGYPAASQYVTAVGGTSLRQSGTTWTETVWSRSGSFCSQYMPQPAWQTALGSRYTSICANRIANDIAAIGDPGTGVAVYDSFGGCTAWCVFGGTSVSTPIIASVYALAGNGASLNSASYLYSHRSSFYDVVGGSNGSCGGMYLCTAGPGFDGPTGNGTPRGLGGF